MVPWMFPRLRFTQLKIAITTELSEGIEVTINAGKDSTALAKITGITPAVFTFNGM